ncbi:hypothetical protein DRO97_08125 [Archaeoglobales archaeon]|nr:MAG: hypothetical protein DRO97_08125 [Archaeoglobales archaeon]
MVVGILVHSTYCPNCELFKNGIIEIERGGEMLEFKGLGRGVESAYEIVREVCTAVGIPIIDIDISQILGYDEDEPQTLYIPEIGEKGFRRKYVPRSVIREWVSEWAKKASIELPAFMIKSNIAKDRYINLEVSLSDPVVAMDWQAARQVLREIARVAIEEKLILMKMNSYEMRELLLMRLFPVNETGKPDVIKWIRGFVSLRHLHLKKR